ncbi:MAG TPA: POTRA domain-containing protein [Nevskiaceae bacterium]|nr:POTRA domain-containing protein [Nevskiaceae bacterium]
MRPDGASGRRGPGRAGWQRLGLLLLVVLPLAAAEPPPSEAPFTLGAIAFEGNAVTRDEVMRRETGLVAGDTVSAERLEQARQAIQDLGLFRSVSLRRETWPEGERVVFIVEEKYYLLPLPRVEANADGDTGYGVQLRWSNIAGLNHRLRALVVQRQYADSSRDAALTTVFNYDAPLIGGSRNSLRVALAHTDQRREPDPAPPYDERLNRISLGLTRSLSPGPPSQGWMAGAGLDWQSQDSRGPLAPPDQGMATALQAQLGYRDLRFDLYSERGTVFESSLLSTLGTLASDYAYLQADLAWRHFQPVGRLRHQSFNTLFQIGSYHGGPGQRPDPAYALGGSQLLRGYDRDRIEGDFRYVLGLEYLHPLGWDSVRLLALAEAGSAWPDASRGAGQPLYGSLGLGLRFRVSWFVNLDLEIGVAYPIGPDGEGLRVFAGSL